MHVWIVRVEVIIIVIINIVIDRNNRHPLIIVIVIIIIKWQIKKPLLIPPLLTLINNHHNNYYNKNHSKNLYHNLIQSITLATVWFVLVITATLIITDCVIVAITLLLQYALLGFREKSCYCIMAHLFIC